MNWRLAVDLIQEFEGCRLTSYPDPGTGGAPWTIGWGSTYIDGKPVKPSQTITQPKADQALLGEVARIAQVLEMKVPNWLWLNVNQQCALISFSYNVGSSWYGNTGFSTITRTLREGRLADVPAALLLYRNPGTNVEAGLRRRRIAEGVLWAAPVQTVTNNAPITLEQLFRFYKQLPHQLAAIAELDADLATNGAAALNRSRPWFKTWSTAGKIPDSNAAAPYLKLSRTGKVDGRGLEALLLERFKNGIRMANMRVVSGAPGRQQFRKGIDSRSGSMEPIPEGQWGINPIAWAGGPDNFAASWGPGLGPASVPLTYKGPGTTGRSAIEAHFDANHGSSPGTAGCIGFNSMDDLKTFLDWIRADRPKDLYVDWELGSCPRPA